MTDLKTSPGRSAEQRAAFAQLRTLAEPHRWRVKADPEGFPIIPGRKGQVEFHDGHELVVYTTKTRMFAKLWAIPGVHRHQVGDAEMRAVFPPEALDQVTGVIGAWRRRVASPDQALRLRQAPSQSGFRDLESTPGDGSGPQHGSEACAPLEAPSAGEVAVG